jgi:hypothetical protein
VYHKKSNILITLLVYQYCTKFWKQITILEQIFIPVLCTILVYQYCDRQVQEIPNWNIVESGIICICILQTQINTIASNILQLHVRLQLSCTTNYIDLIWFIVFNATFINIIVHLTDRKFTSSIINYVILLTLMMFLTSLYHIMCSDMRLPL